MAGRPEVVPGGVVVVTVGLSHDQRNALREAAEEDGESVSALVREALDLWFLERRSHRRVYPDPYAPVVPDDSEF